MSLGSFTHMDTYAMSAVASAAVGYAKYINDPHVSISGTFEVGDIQLGYLRTSAY